MYIKINNLIQKNGVAEYKGLDLNLITPGTQIYPVTENTAYFEYSGELIQNADIVMITEQEYLIKKQEIEINRPKTELELLQEKVAMQEQSILELSMMVTGGAV